MNYCESSIAEKLKAEGWNVLRNGWPDFLCWKDNPDGTRSVVGVEVKDEETGDKLRPSQITNHQVLASIGLPVTVVGSPMQVSVENYVIKKLNACGDIRGQHLANRIHFALLHRQRKGMAEAQAWARRMLVEKEPELAAQLAHIGCPECGRPQHVPEANEPKPEPRKRVRRKRK